MEVNNLKSDTVIVCNKCKDNIKKNSYGYREDFLEIEKRWNYHSSFDNEVHEFALCEKCYRNFIDTFQVPVNIKN